MFERLFQTVGSLLVGFKVNKFHAVAILSQTSTQRIHEPRGTRPNIPANQEFRSSSELSH